MTFSALDPKGKGRSHDRSRDGYRRREHPAAGLRAPQALTCRLDRISPDPDARRMRPR